MHERGLLRKTGLLLRVLRLRSDLDQDALARYLGVSQATISRWENGHGTLPREALEGWLEFCGADEGLVSCLSALHEPLRREEEQRLLAQLEGLLKALVVSPEEQYASLPYFADVAAGLGERQEQRSGPRRYIDVPARIMRSDPRSYALRVSGDSMNPRLSDGDIVVVSPAAPLVEGCVVAAYVEPDGDVVKLYRELPGGAVMLQPLNPDYPTVILGAEQREGRIWGRVVFMSREL